MDERYQPPGADDGERFPDADALAGSSPATRPAAFMPLGVLNIVFGSLWLLMMGLMMVGFVVAGDQIAREVPEFDDSLLGVMLGVIAAMAMLGVLEIIGGVGLIRQRFATGGVVNLVWIILQVLLMLLSLIGGNVGAVLFLAYPIVLFIIVVKNLAAFRRPS